MKPVFTPLESLLKRLSSKRPLGRWRLVDRSTIHLSTSCLHWMAFVVLIATSIGGVRAQAQDGSEPITAGDLLRIHQLGDVTLSPDGRQVVYSVRTVVHGSEIEGRRAANPPDSGAAAGARTSAASAQATYRYLTHLYLADPLRPSENRQLTRGDRSATEPAWHPDGDRIAFVRRVDGTPQIFILPLLGGEAYAATDIESGATAPRWSPDGSRLLFASSLTSEQLRRRTDEDADWPRERPGRREGDVGEAAPDPNGSLEEIRAWLDENALRQRPRVFHRLNFLGETDLEDAPTYRHWFVVAPDSAEREPVLLTRGYFDFDGGEWTADGTRVIVSGMVRDDQHPDRIWHTELYTAFADGSGVLPFFSMDGYSVSSPAVAPDGNTVAFTAHRIDQAGYAQSEIGVLPIDEPSAARLLTLNFDRSTSAPRWSPDGWHLYFTAAANGGFPLYRVPAFDLEAAAGRDSADEADTTALPPDSLRSDALLDSLAADPRADVPPAATPPDAIEADATADSLFEAADSLALAADTLGDAADSLFAHAWQPDLTASAVERLTSFDRGIRSFDVGRATVYYVATEPANPYELFASESPFTADRRLTDHNARWLEAKQLSVPEPRTLMRDSLEIQYWIMKPSRFDSTNSYPLLLQIHGGPAAMWGPGEATMWHEFQFFAARGYGVVFSNPRGSGGYGHAFRRANYQDWGSGPASDVLAAASEAVKEPWLDPERQVVTGGSYAGYLTAWIVAHDHRFEAAVAQRGVYDLGTFLGEGNAWRLVPTHFGGYPWERDPDTTAVAADLNEGMPNTAGEDFEEGLRETAAEDYEEGLPETAAEDFDEALPETPDADPDNAWSEWAAVDFDDALPEPSPDSLGDERLHPFESGLDEKRPDSVSDILMRNSPLTYVDRIQTPLLIIHADNDLRTGVGQSEVLYKSLKILDRPVEYVRYPGSGHDLSRSGDPHLRMDRLLRIYEFMERFIR